ncbi:TPA: hypothetical protein ACJ270_002572 [Salmonella enterica subsp. enterica serovar Newport]
MQDYEKGFIALVVMGGLIALGKLLNSDEPITLRLVAGRVIVGAGSTVHIGSEGVNTLTMMLDTIDLLAELAQQCASHSHPSVGTPTNAGAFNQTAAKAGQTRSKYQNIIA